MKTKRILALAGVIILVLLYVLTLVFALIKSEHSLQLFLISAVSTIAIPLIIHFLLMLINVKNGGKVFDSPYTYRDDPTNKE